MKAGASSRRSDAALLWCACLAAICAGWYLAFGLIGTALDRQHARTEGLYGLELAAAHALAQRPVLAGDAANVDARLRAIAIDADKPTSVARFIHAAVHIAAARRVTITELDERPEPTATEQQHADSIAFDTIPFDVELSGTYRDIIAMIRDLARSSVPMQVYTTAIERSSATGGISSSMLTAHVHVVLQRLPALPAAPAFSSAPRSLPEDPTDHARSL